MEISTNRNLYKRNTPPPKSWDWKYNNWNKKFNREIQIRFKQTEEGISELEDRAMEIIKSEKQKKKNKLNEQNLRELWNTIKWTKYTL